MFKFTLVGKDLDMFHKVLVKSVLSVERKMKEDMYSDIGPVQYNIRTLEHMVELFDLSTLYLKSVDVIKEGDTIGTV
jgi:hypothetical protein